MGANQVFNDIFKPGWFELYDGCMFSGKSMKLLDRINQVDIAKLKWKLFMPECNTRDSALTSRFTEKTFACVKIPENDPQQIFLHVERDVQVIGIDEIVMFDKRLVQIIEYLKKEGKNIVGAGLNQYFNGEPFGIISDLRNEATYEEILHARCTFNDCGNLAERSQRCKRVNPNSSDFVPDDFYAPKIVIEGSAKSTNSQGEIVDMYRYFPVCIHHHEVPNKPQIRDEDIALISSGIERLSDSI